VLGDPSFAEAARVIAAEIEELETVEAVAAVVEEFIAGG
jgi:UDP:flavonoid glycosyltransferase YjiC (YdhE family)